MKNHAPEKANPKKLERFVSLAFQKVGVPLNHADLTAKIIVDADLRGIDSHGVMNLHGYIKGIQNGAINRKPRVRVSSGSPTTASVDGDNGLGFIVSHRAMKESIRMAQEYGTGWTTVCHSNHSGAGAYYVLMAAKNNMIGIHSSSGGVDGSCSWRKGTAHWQQCHRVCRTREETWAICA